MLKRKRRWVTAMAFAASLAAGEMWAQQKPAPDLTGVWNIQNTPQTRYHAYSFSAQAPPMTPWAEERFKAHKPSFGPHAVEDSNDPVNPTTVSALGCFPPGVPRVYLQPFPMEVIQTPGRVMLLYEFNHLVRQIFTDGRKHNTDLGPTWMGDSIGTWDGDTLVVDTVGFNDKTWLDRSGHPHSSDLHVVERIRRPNQDTLQIAVTMEDPKAYTKPWSDTLTFQLHPKWNITEMNCEDNVNFDAFLKNEGKPK